MNDRIILEPNTVYKVRKPMEVGALYQLVRYCYEKDLRFLQALSDIIKDADPFFMENDELERRIKNYIK
jgi:hypothetical protein